MVEYEDFVYLDVQKTGTNTVREFLKRFSKSEFVNKRRHSSVFERSPEKIYIISVRDPFEQYKSLYKSGVAQSGAIRAMFDRAGLGGLYDTNGHGFAEWLETLLDYERSTDVLVRKASHPAMRFFGLLSLRFISLDMPNARRLLDTVESRDDVWPLYEKNRLHDVMLRTESLTADLCALVRGPHGHLFTDPDAAEAHILAASPKNTSPPLSAPVDDLPATLLETLREREWFYYEHLGYSPRVASTAASGSTSRPGPAPRVGRALA